jgi:hypothetical protein
MGYYKGIEGDGEGRIIVLTLRKEFAEFNGIFEYRINEETGVWSFLVGAEGHEKKVEFSNGMTMESFLKHLHQPIKINSKSASTYFK